MEQSLDIQSLFVRVKESATRAIAKGVVPKEDKSFQDIFNLNNEVGRLARSDPDRFEIFKQVQVDINLITIGLKYGRRDDIMRGLALTEKAIESLDGCQIDR